MTPIVGRIFGEFRMGCILSERRTDRGEDAAFLAEAQGWCDVLPLCVTMRSRHLCAKPWNWCVTFSCVCSFVQRYMTFLNINVFFIPNVEHSLSYSFFPFLSESLFLSLLLSLSVSLPPSLPLSLSELVSLPPSLHFLSLSLSHSISLIHIHNKLLGWRPLKYYA